MKTPSKTPPKPTPPPLVLKVEQWEREWLKFDLKGTLNATNIAELEQEFEKWFAKGRKKFAVRFDSYMTLSVAGASVLIAYFRRAQEEGGRGVLLSPGVQVKKTLENLGVLDLCQVCTSPHEVLTLDGDPPGSAPRADGASKGAGPADGPASSDTGTAGFPVSPIDAKTTGRLRAVEVMNSPMPPAGAKGIGRPRDLTTGSLIPDAKTTAKVTPKDAKTGTMPADPKKP